MKKQKMGECIFRRATTKDTEMIWTILQQAIERRRKDGSNQWQYGYPNLNTVKSDISEGYGFVLTIDHQIAVYAALIFNAEPAYQKIDGKWLSEGDFLVIHRVAVAESFKGKGCVKKIFEAIEDYARQLDIYSIKVDTNFDNAAMLAILEKENYTFCGNVILRGGQRKAFEKLLFPNFNGTKR